MKFAYVHSGTFEYACSNNFMKYVITLQYEKVDFAVIKCEYRNNYSNTYHIVLPLYMQLVVKCENESNCFIVQLVL